MAGYPQAYVDYLIHFHMERDYFECHEVLEEYWKKYPDSPFKLAWVGLIQVAVALYHERRGNRAGAMKMLASAEANLSPADLSALGIDAFAFRKLIRERLDKLGREDQPADAAFGDLNIPLLDPELIRLCSSQERYSEAGWAKPSDLADKRLTDKHTLRDRSGVIWAREASAARKREQRRKDER